MGISILDLVLGKLREAGFAADVAFPGQKIPRITKPVAAVHIEQVDRSNLTVTVEVSVICPASLGGTQCETEALRATEALRSTGAECVQSRCSYDGMAQVYTVPILATYTCIAEADGCVMGPGFRVYINGISVSNVLSFQSEQTVGNEVRYEMGEDAPIGISPGSWLWNIRLEELIPGENLEVDSVSEPFTLKVVCGAVEETYLQCRWNSVRREYTREGLRRIRSGISLSREEAENG